MVEQTTRITVDDVLRLGADDKQIEVVNGEVIEMSPTGFLHNVVARNVLLMLHNYVDKHKLGYVGADGLIFVLHSFQDEQGEAVRLARVPDVFFIAKGQFPRFDLSKPFPGAPTLAVEVVSPTEQEGTMLSKVRDYMTYGTQQVWVLYPEQQMIYQYLDTKTINVYDHNDTLHADDLFPELVIPVAQFFVLPTLS